jgi:hypothetical protein
MILIQSLVCTESPILRQVRVDMQFIVANFPCRCHEVEVGIPPPVDLGAITEFQAIPMARYPPGRQTRINIGMLSPILA